MPLWAATFIACAVLFAIGAIFSTRKMEPPVALRRIVEGAVAGAALAATISFFWPWA